MPAAAKRANLFGLGKKSAPAKRPAVTPALKQEAKRAGAKGVNFRDWLSFRGFDYLSAPSSLYDYYQIGAEQREKSGEKKERAQQLKRAARETRAEAKEVKKEGGISGAVPSEAAILKAYEKGATNLREALEMAGAKLNPAKFDRCVKEVARKGGAVSPYAVCQSSLKRMKNPAAAAAEGYKEFHGHAPTEVVTVVKKVHFHEHLSGAGKLKKLVIKGIDYRTTGRIVTLQKFGGALLAFNEAKNQLFIEGGDQSVNLSDFGIDLNRAHELETLGRVTNIDYDTNKTHLGKEGGRATYEHGFRMTNENGEHIVVKIARYPDLIYSVPDEQLLFSGGSYFIRAEGIDQ